MNTSYDTHYQHWVHLQKNKSRHYAHTYLEKPALEKEIARVCNNNIPKRVLLIGCGSGDEVEIVKKHVSHDCEIIGIDSSQQLIDVASFTYSDDPTVTFYCLKGEEINMLHKKSICEYNSIDLVVSSLTLHYIEDWEMLFNDIRKYCTDNASMIFSIQHPIKWGSDTLRSKEKNSFTLGYTKYKQSDTTHPQYTIQGDYLNSRKIEDVLFGRIPVTYYHKSISTIFSIIQNSPFTLQSLIEPTPTEEIKHKSDFYEVYSKIPLFLICTLKIIK